MRLEWIFCMQLIMSVCMIFVLYKLIEMKKKIDHVTKEVMDYILYIMEEEESPKNESIVIKERFENGKEEVQNQLIQAVLGEYFP